MKIDNHNFCVNDILDDLNGDTPDFKHLETLSDKFKVRGNKYPYHTYETAVMKNYFISNEFKEKGGVVR